MADLPAKNTYQFIFKNQTGGERQTVSGEAGQVSKGSVAGGRSRTGDASYGMIAFTKIKEYVRPVVHGELSRVQINTGANEFSARINEAVGWAERGLDMGGNIAFGAMAGGLPGAIAGTVVSLAHTGFDIAQKSMTIQAQKRIENVSLEISRRRAGVSGSRT